MALTGQKRSREGEGAGVDGGRDERPVVVPTSGDGARASSPASASSSGASSSGAEGAATCWICLGEGGDDDGDLRRDCSCRGSAGFAHISCLIDYARHRSEAWDEEKPYSFRSAWRKCPRCEQMYQNNLAAELAAAFVAFTRDTFPDDQSKLVDALNVQVIAATAGGKMGPAAKTIANKVLSAVEQMRMENSPFVMRTQVNALNVLGVSSLYNYTKESAKTALGYFERALEISKDLGWAIAIAMVEDNIARANVCLEDNGDTVGVEKKDERMERRRKMYHQFTKERGATSSGTIVVGLDFVRSLDESRRLIEGERVLSKLFDACKQVHGPDHRLTQKVEMLLAPRRERFVRIVPADRRGMFAKFQALRYEDAGKKCVLQGPVAIFPQQRNTEAEETFTVSSEDIWLELRTPVVCWGHLNGQMGHIHSWDIESGIYKVQFEDDDIGIFPVEKKFVRILFDLTGE